MKQLVIYFSRNGENYTSDGIRNIEIGNTEKVANYIKEITGASLFKVEPIIEYPYNYHECCNVAKKEIENNIRPKVKNELDDINDYDVIYIGGPIWYGHYPTPLLTVLEKLDFSSKIVMPFTTHEGSGFGSVISDIKRICNNALIKDGLAIYGSNASDSKEMLKGWCIK